MSKRSEPSAEGPNSREPLTADTITDEQIRELMGSVADSLDEDHDADNPTIQICVQALSPRDSVGRGFARARCAEILNARAEVKGAGK